MKLFPRLPTAVAADLADELRQLPVDELDRRASDHHSSAIYTATGGTRVDRTEIRDLRRELVEVAHEFADSRDYRQTQRFDADCSRVIFERLLISPNEAAKPGVWAFLACVVAPDLVRRRFPGTDGTSTERFLGKGRGIRNAFGRLWWRAYALRESGSQEPYRLLQALGEDELVQLTERPTISGHPPLARAIAAASLESGRQSYPGGRPALIRDAVKRVRRRAGLVAIEALPQPVLQGQVASLFGESMAAAGIAEVDASLGAWASDAGYGAVRPTTAHSDVRVVAESAGQSTFLFEKTLSANDIGDTGSHQSAIVVPKPAVARMPVLDEDAANPELTMIVVDRDSNRIWQWRYIHYNSRVRGSGTRDEYRLTGTTEYLAAVRANAGNRIWVGLMPNGSLVVELVR